MAGLLDQERDDTMADVTVIVEEKPIKLHRAILATRSEYFEKMLTNGMYETKASHIRLEDVSYDVFVALLNFLYTDQIPKGDALVLPLLHQVRTLFLRIIVTIFSDFFLFPV